MRTEPTAKGRAIAQRVLDAWANCSPGGGAAPRRSTRSALRARTGRGQFYLCVAGKPDLVAAVVAQQVERVLDAQQPLLGRMSTAADVRAVWRGGSAVLR